MTAEKIQPYEVVQRHNSRYYYVYQPAKTVDGQQKPAHWQIRGYVCGRCCYSSTNWRNMLEHTSTRRCYHNQPRYQDEQEFDAQALTQIKRENYETE